MADRPCVVTLTRGDQAFERLYDATFVAEWAHLQAGCAWATECQTHAFVESWYRLHRDSYEPVILEGRADDARLIGLLTLARKRTGRDLVAAGAFQAEYQAWITEPDVASAFTRRAFDRLEREFANGSLKLRYLPPGLPEASIGASTMTRHVRVRVAQRGIIDLADISPVEDLLRKGRNRNRLNGLRRSGEVVLETLGSVDELAAEMDRIGTLVDLRQGAINDVMPFSDNPLKRPFNLELMERGLVHASVLRVGRTMASVHLDHRNGDEVRLGVIAHEPAAARRSPGSLHILMLAQDLAGKGFARYDMSPGAGASYKDRFAARYDPVRIMDMHFGAVDRVRAGVFRGTVGIGRALLAPIGHTPGSAVDAVRRWPERLRGSARGVPAAASDPPLTAVYRLPGPAEPASHLRFDALEDLLKVGGPTGRRDRQAFLSRSMSRLEVGHHVLTMTDGPELTECWWLERLDAPDASGPAPVLTDVRGATSLMAYDPFFSTAPGSNGRPEAVARLAATVKALAPAATIFVTVAHDDRGLIEALDAAGAVRVDVIERSAPLDDLEPATDSPAGVTA